MTNEEKYNPQPEEDDYGPDWDGTYDERWDDYENWICDCPDCCDDRLESDEDY